VTAPPRPIPRPRDGLTQRQVRGYACVWCARELDETAVDLPPQRFRILDRVTRWYPRACRGCTS
jgi:hypothetical protein